jgi:hypothetical protein
LAARAAKASATIERSGLVALTALAIACVPQLVQRGDPTHVLYAIVPALLLASVWIERVLRTQTTRAAKVLGAGSLTFVIILSQNELLASPFAAAKRSSVVLGGPFGQTFAETDSDAVERRAAVAFLRTHSKPSEKVFSGCTTNRRSQTVALDLYFLADRRGGTKWLQYDPGLQDTEEYQRRIINDLNQSRVNAIVLSPCPYVPEKNESAKLGSTLLDRWFAKEFRVVGGSNGYRHLLRTVDDLSVRNSLRRRNG